MVNPVKIYDAMRHLKTEGNPYYQFYTDPGTYEARCAQDNNDELFGRDWNPDEPPAGENLEQEYEMEGEVEKEQENEDQIIRDEEEYRTKDPVKKHQFSYDQSIAMSNMHPEVTEKDQNQKKTPNMVSVAPGEGCTPLDIMFDKDWDVKSYPHIHQPNGTNGLDQEREIKLTSQRYLVNRIIHKEQKFSKCAPYLYAAVNHTEKKTIK